MARTPSPPPEMVMDDSHFHLGRDYHRVPPAWSVADNPHLASSAQLPCFTPQDNILGALLMSGLASMTGEEDVALMIAFARCLSVPETEKHLTWAIKCHPTSPGHVYCYKVKPSKQSNLSQDRNWSAAACPHLDHHPANEQSIPKIIAAAYLGAMYSEIPRSIVPSSRPVFSQAAMYAALMAALCGKQLHLVATLVRSGYQFHNPTQEIPLVLYRPPVNHTVLAVAAGAGLTAMQVVSEKLDIGVSSAQSGKGSLAPLITAVRSGNGVAAEELVQNGFLSDFLPEHGITALSADDIKQRETLLLDMLRSDDWKALVRLFCEVGGLSTAMILRVALTHSNLEPCTFLLERCDPSTLAKEFRRSWISWVEVAQLLRNPDSEAATAVFKNTLAMAQRGGISLHRDKDRNVCSGALMAAVADALPNDSDVGAFKIALQCLRDDFGMDFVCVAKDEPQLLQYVARAQTQARLHYLNIQQFEAAIECGAHPSVDPLDGSSLVGDLLYLKVGFKLVRLPLIDLIIRFARMGMKVNCNDSRMPFATSLIPRLERHVAEIAKELAKRKVLSLEVYRDSALGPWL